MFRWGLVVIALLCATPPAGAQCPEGARLLATADIDFDSQYEQLCVQPQWNEGVWQAVDLDGDGDVDVVTVGGNHTVSDLVVADVEGQPAFVLCRSDWLIGASVGFSVDEPGGDIDLVWVGCKGATSRLEARDVDDDFDEEIIITIDGIAPGTSIDIDLDADGDADLIAYGDSAPVRRKTWFEESITRTSQDEAVSWSHLKAVYR